ncbi:MAG: hypothetical protein KF730_00970 [Sphingomonas sp.]|uniref:hypothetical protein n=1 Tax=Sphingomonas sp. TaxID=28214 RepID=UPI0025EAC930|nr:hypothetical protein [Sphingomonas sp.]MBX3563124.1 hypothetical protein [Sphingomonas sp.]
MLPDGTSVVAGPQFMILSSGDPGLLNMNDDMQHTPSGFHCPRRFEGLAVLLMTIEPKADRLTCSYRAGTDLRLRDTDEARYQIVLIRAGSGQTPRSIFDGLVASARAGLRIKGDHLPPLAVGRSPAPLFVAYWDTEGAGVQGVWVYKAGRWIVWLRAQYPPASANDAEAGSIAHILFAEAGRLN